MHICGIYKWCERLLDPSTDRLIIEHNVHYMHHWSHMQRPLYHYLHQTSVIMSPLSEIMVQISLLNLIRKMISM
jgi:hypothetical protein